MSASYFYISMNSFENSLKFDITYFLLKKCHEQNKLSNKEINILICIFHRFIRNMARNTFKNHLFSFS